MWVRLLLIVLVMSGVISCPHSIPADIGPLVMFKGGGVVAPASPHNSIRLDSQEVIIRLKFWTYEVNVEFNLFNEGETSEEWVGFPKWTASRLDSFPTFIRFQGTMNGKKIAFKEEVDQSRRERYQWIMASHEWHRLTNMPMKHERQWLVSRLTFPGRARTKIQVSYEAPYYGKGILQASYLYGTGSLWKGNIGKALFVVDRSEVGDSKQILTHFPKGFGSVPRHISKNILCFEIKDFEPDPEARFRIEFDKPRCFRSNYVRPKRTGGPIPVLPPPPVPVREK